MFVIIVIIFGILISMVVHEVMHAFASHWLGDDTATRLGRLTLNPLAHIDPITTVALPLLLISMGLPPFAAAKPVPFNPYKVRFGEFGAALVGIAGPIANLLIAIILGLWARYVIGFDGGLIAESFKIIILLNISLFVFNMIPFPPLDGSRLLYAFAPDSLKGLMASIERLGFFAIAIFMFGIFPLLSGTFTKAVEVIFRFVTGIELVI